ncbi:MAG: hypothetical protein AUJ28_00095 [Parcubacteria group bacterium CG1_02_37_51]|uniref:Uncharacterized protein n=2 Tax=Candidatus Komeiliibacteriota TaxID=1817908 RepID=A0A2M8DQZ6_9BACT|nr:MAG: hypothetical protein AUJ28_00095 [Parcubacteria group bacterium CG1_02_37_51]PIY94902.1 MAG: hypothetical protein COY67_01810 [Candidatus Komeilibacteria bacterium CG_4_10_14_0_8_um_filter_37_78]PJC01766.1 MAG: hypothetical protein CO073_02950 [Candidatus Komeilibacteria bacterium CG_4_9_14_0_8_um_filter_36_9]
MDETISPEQQMLVIERLYRSNDSISSTRKFNEEFGEEIGKIGEKTLRLNDFYRMLKAAEFMRWRIKEIINEIIGFTIDLY